RRPVGVRGGGGDADRSPNGGALGHAVGRRVRVSRGARVDVGDGDGERLRGTAAGAVGGPHGDAVAGGRLEVQQAPVGHGDDAGGGVDRKSAAGVVGQAVSHCRAVGVRGGGGDADRRAAGGALG